MRISQVLYFPAVRSLAPLRLASPLRVSSKLSDQLIAKLHQLSGRLHQDLLVIGTMDALDVMMKWS